MLTQVYSKEVDFIIFITRRHDILPPIIRLNREWAAVAFMLGESVETSAGDPTEAGKAVRVVGTNPFIVGPEEEEGNIFLDILKNHPDIQCFILNTGHVGGMDRKKDHYQGFGEGFGDDSQRQNRLGKG